MVIELGDDAEEGAVREQGARDTDELGDATIDPAHAGEDVAENEVEKAFHRSQENHWQILLINQ